MEFLKQGQAERLKIIKSIYSKYWEWGFKSRLYNLLSPQAYLDSLQRAANYCDLKAGQMVLDAGCGSGLLIPFLAKDLENGGRYLGMANECDGRKRTIKEFEALNKSDEQQIKQAIGDASSATFTDGSGYIVSDIAGSTFETTRKPYRSMKRRKGKDAA